jgi:trehalose-phosphatase
MKDLFSCWTAIAGKIKSAKHIFLLLDYDGTLTPIVKRPESAYLSPQIRDCLRELATNPSLTLGIISGRALSDVRAKVGIANALYAGNHGLEIEGPNICFTNSKAIQAMPLLHSLGQDISLALAGIEGAWIEDKKLTLSLHYRLCNRLKEVFNEITKEPLADARIMVTSNKKTYDIRPPVNWDKGKAIEFINEILFPKDKPFMLFVGDDKTDYDAFRVVNTAHGISVFVGTANIKSPACYFLQSTDEVHQLLLMLQAIFNCQ